MDKIKFLDIDHIENVFAAIRIAGGKWVVRDRAFIQCAYFCGLRASEVGLLTWSDYLPRTKSLFIRRLKKGKDSTVRLLDRYAALLDAWHKATLYSMPTDPIFTSRSGRPLDRKSIDKIFRRYAGEAKIRRDHRHFHVLRHSIAVHLLDSGVDIADVQHHLGHKNIRNTLIYAQYTSLRQRRFNQIVAASRFIAK